MSIPTSSCHRLNIDEHKPVYGFLKRVRKQYDSYRLFQGTHSALAKGKSVNVTLDSVRTSFLQSSSLSVKDVLSCIYTTQKQMQNQHHLQMDS